MKTRILFGLIGMVQRKRASAQPLPVKANASLFILTVAGHELQQ
jgi:hypothetical protein